MTLLPTSGESTSLDSVAVTREQFRGDIGSLLAYLAQALGGVAGAYTTQTIDPLGVVLAGEPSLKSDAVPDPADDSLRIPSTGWVNARQLFAIVGGNIVPITANQPLKVSTSSGGGAAFLATHPGKAGAHLGYGVDHYPVLYTPDNDIRIESGARTILTQDGGDNYIFTDASALFNKTLAVKHDSAIGAAVRVVCLSSSVGTIQFTDATQATELGGLTFNESGPTLLFSQSRQLRFKGNDGTYPFAYFDGANNNIALVSNAGTWIAVSDERLKESISPIDYGLNEILALQPKRYKLKSESAETEAKHFGLIAQEVQSAMPELVVPLAVAQGAEEGQEAYVGLNYAEITPILIKAVQELAARVAELEARP